MGYERDALAWTQICNAEVMGEGPFKRTAIDESVVKEVSADAFERISFYMTLTTPKMRYTKPSETDTIVVGDVSDALPDVTIMVGSGIGGYPFGHPFTPRIWNGSIRYVTDKPKVTPAPTAASTPSDKNPGDFYNYGPKMELSTVGEEMLQLFVGLFPAPLSEFPPSPSLVFLDFFEREWRIW